jgi:N-formylglutamate deformylase
VSPALFETRRGSLPILISFPHSGTYVPEALRERFTSAGQQLPDTDWFVTELYRGCLEQLGVSALIATHSRYVVDLNRPPDGQALYPGQIESAVCPTHSFSGAAIYRPGQELAAAETPGRIERYWHPYHRALAELRDEILARHERCVIWDAHSIRSLEPRLFEGQLPELNLGTWNARSAGAHIIQSVVALLAAQQRFSHVVDGRFKGGYITRHYGAPARRVHALQLEIAQRAYMSEHAAPQFDPEFAAPLSSLLEKIIPALV